MYNMYLVLCCLDGNERDCLNRFKWTTRISGKVHKPSFFTTSCLRLHCGQCQAFSGPNTSSLVYNYNIIKIM